MPSSQPFDNSTEYPCLAKDHEGDEGRKGDVVRAVRAEGRGGVGAASPEVYIRARREAANTTNPIGSTGLREE